MRTLGTRRTVQHPDLEAPNVLPERLDDVRSHEQLCAAATTMRVLAGQAWLREQEPQLGLTDIARDARRSSADTKPCCEAIRRSSSARGRVQRYGVDIGATFEFVQHLRG